MNRRVLLVGQRVRCQLTGILFLKTGTADQFQNIWALAATPDYTIGVWMGNFSGETVIGETGSALPARLAMEILGELGSAKESFPSPDGARRVKCLSRVEDHNISAKEPHPHFSWRCYSIPPYFQHTKVFLNRRL